MKITVLIENKECENLCSEHGLSMWIEYEGESYLLDTGSTDLFCENAKRLGIDLKNAKLAVLSHSHYDHSGGFAAFLDHNKEAKVYLQKSAKELCYSMSGGKKRYIGLPEGLLQNYRERFVFLEEKTEIAKGVWLVPHTIPNLSERGEKMEMYRENDQGFVPDDFSHEQSLVFESGERLVVLNSCCHAGVENIIREVRESFGGRKVQAVFGGFHLKGSAGPDSMRVTEQEVVELAERLKESEVECVYTGHCTGNAAYEILKKCMGEQIQYLYTGMTVEL